MSFSGVTKIHTFTPLPPPGTELNISCSDGASSKSSCHLATVNIPEVMEYVFKYMDVKQLQKCRFVNPAWNQEACRALQRKAHVFLNEDSARSSELLELMSKGIEIGSGLSKSAPTPFKRYHVSVETFSDDKLNEIINRKESSVIELYMNKPPPLNHSDFQKKFHKVLLKNGGCLKYLRLALQDGVNLGLTNAHDKDQNQLLFLPSLQDFGFWEYHHNSHHSDKSASIDFLVDIINAAPNLIQLCSSSSDANVISEILTRANLKNIENIYAECITGSHVIELSRLQLPKLKSLILQSEMDAIPDSQRVSSAILQNLVRNFSNSLEELNISWISDIQMMEVDDDFPTCPNLKKLSIDGWYGSLGVFDSVKLPKLESILIVDHQEVEDSICNPHEGVTTIVVECPQGVVSQGVGFYSDEEFDSFLFYLRRQFPNTRTLDLTMPLTDEAVRSVIRNFPELETLILDTKSALSSHVFTGRNQLILQRFVEEGYDLEEIAMQPSLRDLPHLKKLVVGRYTRSMFPEGLVVTNDMIQYGIAEIPCLESFQLNWNPELSVEVFSGSLWYLNTIIVNNSRDLEVQPAMNELTACMFQVLLESNTL